MEEHVDYDKNQKNQTWIWVAAGAVVLCLCCAVLGVAVAAILYLVPVSGAIGPGDIPAPVEPTAMPFPDPTPVRIAPPQTVVVDPVDPNNIPLRALTVYELVLGYEGLNEPGQNTWQTSFPYDQPILIFTGWCTSTTDLLDQNFEHILFLLEIDGQDIPVQGLSWADAPGNDGYCRSYYGLVEAWPVGTHTIVMTMRFDEDINDGWSDYSAGDYVDQIEIMATP